jgi:hypothetical protein
VDLKREYQGLSREQLLEEAYQKGGNYVRNTGGCASCTMAALRDILGFDAGLVKASTSLSGGTAEQFLGTCGVLSAGVLVLGHYIGRPAEKMSDKESIQENREAVKVSHETAQKLADKFVKEYGTVTCSGLHRKLLGRIFCLTDKEELGKFVNLGGMEVAADIVGKGARWVMEVLLDEGIIKL